MQNKGFIRVFAVLLALVSLYQLSFTFKVNRIEKAADKYALVGETPDEQLKLRNAYLDSLANVTVYDIGVKEFTYRDCQALQLNLGLDLKGGMNVMLEVSVPDIVKALSNDSQDPTFVKAMELAQARMEASQEDFITLFGQAFEEVDNGASLAAIFSTFELKEKVTYNSTNKEVLDVLRAESADAISNSFNVLRTRIDRFGVAQPNIQRVGSETSGRILIELPGVKDRERVRKLLQGTANLEFWETYENSEVYASLIEANAVLADLLSVDEEVSEEASSEDVVAEETPKEETSEVDELLSEIESDSTSAAGQAEFEKNYPLFSVLSPNAQGSQIGQGPVVGYAREIDREKVEEYLAMPQVQEVLPRDVKFRWTVNPVTFGSKSEGTATEFYQLIALKITNRDGKAPLAGDVIVDARQDYSQTGQGAEVNMTMNPEGARIWARLTKENVGRSVAVVLDDYVYSFPTVNQEITGGRSNITGNFTVEEAKDLANVLKSGKMPAPAYIVQEDIVGPSLGQEAIDSGMKSFLIAFLVVLLYMMFYYGVVAGLVADFALIANLFFVFGVLASFGAVLTLPGIAGIVLTIGTAVDANVLIYERIREELASGKGLSKAISDGYKAAFSAIIDANVTTFLTGFILFTFGTGPIKGFATTLMIGIVTSFFSAIFLSRLVFEQLLKKKDRQIPFTTAITRNWFQNTSIRFIEKRKVFYAISSVLILVGIISMFARGFDQGIDFTGGRTFTVRFDESVKTEDIANSLKDSFDGVAPNVKTFGADNQVKITTNFMISDHSATIDDEIENRLYEGLKVYANDVDLATFKAENIVSSQKVGPTIADDIKKAAVWAILFSLVVVFLYILMRFRNWQFSLGAVAALSHDVLITLGVFSLLYSIMPFSMQIDQSFIAAILTVIGYSINDTVVVFDRIRERVGLYPKRDRVIVINNALNSTLSRTLSTSLSTIFVLLSMFLFGGEVIRGFIFALLVGVVVGTYSSLFVATPIAFDAQKKIAKPEPKKKK